MKIFALGDLHLSGDPPKKPMDVFGSHWAEHRKKIQNNWQSTVGKDDVVIVCGDISWALTFDEAQEDLLWLSELWGNKILLRGNHDYWWTTVSKMRQQYSFFQFLQNDSILINDLAICGSRGWKVPSNDDFSQEDKKIYERELIRLELSLQDAVKKGGKDILVALHFPPIFHEDEENGFTDLFKKYSVKQVVFGHIHGENNISVFEGEKDGVTYKLCSSDTQNFTPVLIFDY